MLIIIIALIFCLIMPSGGMGSEWSCLGYEIYLLIKKKLLS
jgi:hypothetical protein